jgi:uncharacterized YigZ family protein
MEQYTTISGSGTAEFRDRGSRFIGYALPIADIDDAKEKLALLKKEHPKAVHHCFAWRLGPDGSEFRANDDGEPSGSAGRPILGQLQSRGITNAMVVVVRYFGGTLLGVPGLINAYKTAAADALGNAPVQLKNIETRILIQCDYTVMNEVMTVIRHFQCTIHARELLLFCRFDIGVPVSSMEALLDRLSDIKGVEVGK